jgi:hypothetical protein
MPRHKAIRHHILTARDCEILEQCIRLVRKINPRFFASAEANTLLFRLAVIREEAEEAAILAAKTEEEAAADEKSLPPG